MAPTLPQRLRAAAESESEVREWVARLPTAVDQVSGRWSLQVGAPYEPGGTAAWVAPARTADAQRVVVKIGRRHWEADQEADGLRAWNGDGTIRLIDNARLDDYTDVLILEACEPGTSAKALPEPEQDVLVAGLLRRLWITPAGRFRPLDGMCARWADELDTERAAARVGDAGLVAAGIELFRELPKGGPPHVLLATDLHAENVLAAQREPWLVIDPKPYLGDPTYDALQHMLNCPQRLTTDPHGLARRMAGLLDLDAGRLTQWLFARCVIESEWREPAAAARALAPR